MPQGKFTFQNQGREVVECNKVHSFCLASSDRSGALSYHRIARAKKPAEIVSLNSPERLLSRYSRLCITAGVLDRLRM